MALKNARRHLDESAMQRKKCKKSSSSESMGAAASDTSEPKRKQHNGERKDCISETRAQELTMLAMRSSLDRVEEIKAAMRETFPNRQKWIQESAPCVAEIFQKFPRYKDIPQLVRHLSRHLSHIGLVIFPFRLLFQVHFHNKSFEIGHILIDDVKITITQKF